MADKLLGVRIRKMREALGLQQAGLAKLVGVDQTTVSRWEADKQYPDGTSLVKLARLGNTTVEEWTGAPETRSVPVKELYVIGSIQAGEWVEAYERPQDEWYLISVPNHPLYGHLHHFGLEVLGPSMNEIYPAGTIVDCVRVLELGRDPVPNERVVVERVRKDGLIEATVKEFRLDSEGEPWLWPRSDHPEHQQPIPLRKPNGDGSEEVRITGLVTGSYRFEVPAA